MIEICQARTADEVVACFPVMQALRPHLADAEELFARVRRQGEQGYRLFVARSGAAVVGAAGFRVQENLIRGRFCYVDDLVVAETQRRRSIGARLLDAVAVEARAAGCGRLTLDTGLDNLLGQRFYFRYGMLPSSLRFGMALD